MSLRTQMWITCFVVWTFCRVADHFLPPGNPTFDAMLTVICGLALIAGHIDDKRR